MNAEETFTALLNVARTAAHHVHRAHRGYTTIDDLTQEGITWLLSKPGQKRVENHTFDTGELHYTALVSDVVNRCLIPFALNERREAYRGDVGDGYVYTEQVVEAVLPAVFDPDFRLTPASEERVSGSNDPATGNNWAAFVVDVKRAVDAVCSMEDRRVLFTRSVGGWTWARFGEVYSRSGEWHRLRYRDVLSRLVAFLNGRVVLGGGELVDGRVQGGVLRRRPDKVVDV